MIDSSEFHFLFRTDEGEISREVWWGGIVLIAVPMLILSVVWLILEPFATGGLVHSAAAVPLRAFAFLYLLVYSFAVIIAAICFYNLSAKRFRARRKPGSLAGLLPFALLVTGALAWLQPRSEGVLPPAVPLALLALDVALAIWFVIDLGLVRDKASPG